MTKLRQLWLLTALGSVALLAGGYFLLVAPQSNKAAALRGEAQTQLQVNKQLESQIDMLNEQKKKLPERQADLATFARLIPDNPALPALLRALTDASDNAGVELLSVSPVLPEYAKSVDPKTGAASEARLQAPAGQVLVDIPVTLRIKGEYSKVSSFFAEIEDLNRALLVSGFTIEAANVERGAARGTRTDNLEAEISAHVMMTRKAPVTTTRTSGSSDDDATK